MSNPLDTILRTRNVYNPDEYFSLNVRNGVMRNPVGTRMLTIPEELLMGLHLGLQEETGSASGLILYQCGKWWGKQFVKKQTIETRHFYSAETADLPLSLYLHVLRSVWAMFGWGKLDLSFDLRDRGFMEATVHQSVYSDVVGNIGRTSDELIAGVLASIMSDMAGRDLECVETACKSRGDHRCSFVVGIKSRVDIVTAWSKQGKSHAEIVETIARGDLS